MITPESTMRNRATLFAGALGGLAPNLARLSVDYTSTLAGNMLNEPVLSTARQSY